MAIDSNMMMQSIYDALYGSLTGDVPGVAASRSVPPSSGFLTLLKPGLRIEPMLYANAWSPVNPEGSDVAGRALAELVSQAPALNPMYTPIGRVEDFYEEIVRAEVDPSPPNPEQEAAVAAAENFLFDDGVDFDPVTGQPVTVPNSVDSPAYANYKNKFALFEAALTSYLAQWQQVDQSNPKDMQAWAIIAPILQTKVRMAYAEFDTSKPGIIKEKESILGQASQIGLVRRFAEARRIFELAPRGEGFSAYLPVQAFPANWPTTQAYSNVELNSNEIHTSSSSSFGSWNAGGSLNFGLFSIGGGGGRSWSNHTLHQDTTNLRLSFQFARVDIRRSWLKENLLTTTGWRVEGRGKNGYSTGDVDRSNTGVFPLLPVAFIVARQVRATASWSAVDKQTFTQTMQAGGGIRIGPFQFGGGGGSSSTTSSTWAASNQTDLYTPDLEIVAFLNRVVPACPPK
ncbi:hypothetical protein ACN28S_19775 [Cystobacter fuscus]